MSALDIDAGVVGCGFVTDGLAASFAGVAETLAAALAGLEGSRPITVIDLSITGRESNCGCVKANCVFEVAVCPDDPGEDM